VAAVAAALGPSADRAPPGLHPSTVHKVLTRYRMARLAWLDRSIGRVVRRYEHAHPGDLVHLDVKKLGRRYQVVCVNAS